jgi:hypothetical protein
MLKGDKMLIDSFIKPKGQNVLFVDEYAPRSGYS